MLPTDEQSIATSLFSACNHSVANKVNILHEEQKSSRFGRYCTFVPPLGLGLATVKLSAAFFHDESSMGGGGRTKVQ